MNISRRGNPFLDSRVVNAWETLKADLADFNRASYEQCLATMDEVRLQSKSFSIVVNGEAGSGKTHLLSKLRESCEKNAGTVFAAARLDCAASMLWRHFRRQLAESLMRGEPPPIESLAAIEPQALDRVQPANLRRALRCIAEGSYRFDALDWLRGDPISAVMMTHMGMGIPSDLEENAESEAEEIVRSLAKLIAPRTLVFCLDQVEAIQSHPGDRASLFQLGQAAAGLVDKSNNICLIFCVQTAFIDEMQLDIREADRHRIMMRRTGLELLSRDQARELVRMRQQGIEGLSATWPVDEAKLLEAMPQGREVIRKVLFSAARLFEEGITGEAPPRQSREEYLATAFEQEREKAESVVNSNLADHVLRDGLPLLLYQEGWSIGQKRAGLPEPTLVHERGAERRYVVLINDANPSSLIGKLRRLNASDVPMKQVAAIRDATLGIGPRARVSREHLQTLKERGGTFVEVSREALVALEAMRKLLSKAASGDLSFEGETLPEQFVAQWLKGHLPVGLQGLLREIGGEAVSRPEHLASIVAYISQAKIASIAEIAEKTGLSADLIEDCARHHPQQLVRFGGALPTLAHGIGA